MGEKAFVRACPRHLEVLFEGKGDSLLCPSGHVAERFGVFEVGKLKALKTRAGGRVMKGSAAARVEVPSISGGIHKKPGGGKTLDSQGFRNKKGDRKLRILLEDGSGGRIAPFIVRVHHQIGEGKKRAGIIETAATLDEAQKAFETCVQKAMDEGWQLGTSYRPSGLTEIPSADGDGGDEDDTDE